MGRPVIPLSWYPVSHTRRRALVFHVGATALEGDADSVVVLRADSEEALRGFYDDPGYAGPKALRHSITSGADMILAPGFTPAN